MTCAVYAKVYVFETKNARQVRILMRVPGSRRRYRGVRKNVTGDKPPFVGYYLYPSATFRVRSRIYTRTYVNVIRKYYVVAAVIRIWLDGGSRKNGLRGQGTPTIQHALAKTVSFWSFW